MRRKARPERSQDHSPLDRHRRVGDRASGLSEPVADAGAVAVKDDSCRPSRGGAQRLNRDSIPAGVNRFSQCGVIPWGEVMFIRPMVRLLLMAAVGLGICIFLQLYNFSDKTKPPSSVAEAETRFSSFNDLEKMKAENIWLSQQERQIGEPGSRSPLAAIAERAKPEAKMREPTARDPAVSVSVSPPDSKKGKTFTEAQAPLKILRTCLKIEDQSKERLNCYDQKIAPEPKQISSRAKTVRDCRFVREEDERLECFNRFVSPPPKKNTAEQTRQNP
jgi:hypothetical protein